ncbi:hypothetical protein L0Z64_02090 [Phaeobacter sp. BS23]|uniref:hypothetical protein n=1 Tax=Phaeobacter sp. BS23 TaxID=2907239 RepID=UPI003869EF53
MLMLAAMLGVAAVGGILLIDEGGDDPDSPDTREGSDDDAAKGSTGETVSLDALVSTGTAASDQLGGGDTDDLLQGLAGHDQLNGYAER